MDIETSASTTYLDLNNTALDGDPAINFQLTGTTTFSIGVNDGEADEFRIGTTDLEDAQTRLGIDALGNVGIGTVTYTALLNVDGDAIFNESGNSVDFRVEGDTEANLLFVDASADFIGIGTSGPTAMLDVRGEINCQPATDAGNGFELYSQDRARFMWMTAPVNGSFSDPFIINTHNAFDIQVDAISVLSLDGNGNATFNESGASDQDFRVESNGKTHMIFVDASANFVGIGNSAPSVALDVTGSIEYTGTIVDVSDRRLKENFSSIDSVLTKIMKIEGLSYNMINDTSQIREYGVIAQDVQAVFPEMVSIVDPENGYLGVAYIQLVPILLEATKAQQAIIDAQNKEIENLKQETSSAINSSTDNAKKFAALEAKLNALLLNQNVTLSAKK